LEVFGVRLNAEKNDVRSKEPRCISTPESSVKVFVIPINEELAISREVANVLRE
jgi:acetate kinase